MPADARSGAVFERVVVGPDCYFVKRVSFASDWLMRASGDHACRQYLVWQAGSWTSPRTASITMAQRIRLFAPGTIAAELTAAEVPAAAAAAAAGWAALPGRSPLLWQLARLVHDRPEMITRPLSQTPRTFLPGNWKPGNLGTHPDGRTILLDWAFPAPGPPAGTCARSA